MNARTGVWAAVILVLAAAAAIAFGLKGNRGPDFSINDRYIEATPQGTIAYYFVETSSLDTSYLTKVGQFLKKDYLREIKGDKVQPQMTMLLGQFYRQSDVVPLTDEQASQMNIPPAERAKFREKLQYVPKAFVYREFIGSVPGMQTPPPGVLPAPVIVPKKGHSISELIPKK
ncbi:MAG: hypothetical protein V4642_07550 [Bacteroidota bacterium]